MGIIKKQIDSSIKITVRREKTDFATLDTEIGEFEIRNRPIGSRHLISLKDVSYEITDGILFIKGTRIFWKRPSEIFYRIYNWDDAFELPENYDKKYDIPNYLIKENFRKNWFVKYPLVLDMRKISYDKTWIREKRESDFEYALHPFKICESK